MKAVNCLVIFSIFLQFYGAVSFEKPTAAALSITNEEELRFVDNFYKCSEPSSSFSTDYRTSQEERKHNIKLACSKLNARIIKPQECLSFNAVVGARTFKNGYRKATVIEQGKFTAGIGGGVCQVSSTLYNAALLAGLEIAAYRAHTLPVSYVPLSLDATVSEKIDLVIKNPYSSPVYIECFADGKTLSFKIYCETPYNNAVVKLRSKLIRELPASIKDIEDKDCVLLENESEKITVQAQSGYISESYMDFYSLKKELIKSVKIRQDRYEPVTGERIIKAHGGFAGVQPPRGGIVKGEVAPLT